jgi:hypothetical protein
MPKRINPEDRWEVDFQVPLPGEPRNIGPLEVLFQRLLNRTERLKNHIASILGLPWDATPPDTLAGLAGRVGTLEASMANVSADPLPHTIALRNAQGVVQNGATYGPYKVLQLGGIYSWVTANRWLRLAQWTGVSGPHRGIFADLRIYRVWSTSISARLRAVLKTDGFGQFTAQLISVANDHSSDVIVTNAVLVQTDPDTFELWALFPLPHVYVSGVVGHNADSVSLTPYGDVGSLVQNTAPTPVSGGLYLEWAAATVVQTFPGPGYIVAASRGATSGYVRYDNGIQAVWGIANMGNGTWLFPAAFASPPQVQAIAETGNATPRVVTLTHVSTVGVGILRTDLSGNVQSGAVHLYAVGLWK